MQLIQIIQIIHAEHDTWYTVLKIVDSADHENQGYNSVSPETCGSRKADLISPMRALDIPHVYFNQDDKIPHLPGPIICYFSAGFLENGESVNIT